MNKSIVLLVALLLTGCADIAMVTDPAAYLGYQCEKIGHVKGSEAWQGCTERLLNAHMSSAELVVTQ